MAAPAGIAILSLASLVLWADFESWKRAGTGGTPPTLQGYLKMRRWGLYLLYKWQDLNDITPIPNTGPSYIIRDRVPQRNRNPPQITRWQVKPSPFERRHEQITVQRTTLPQRQHLEPITEDAREALLRIPDYINTTPPYSEYFSMAPSKTEGGTGPAVYVKPNANIRTINPNAHKIFYEVAHVHPQDNSLHVYLSPRDARFVIEKGWGRRFPIDWLAPASWIMVYAPRDEGEVEIVRSIVKAACDFAVGIELTASS